MSSPALQRYLITRLAVPLGILAIVTAWLEHVVVGSSGFFYGLSTTFIGTIVTVFYVERVMARFREEQWAPALEHLARQLHLYVRYLVQGLRSWMRDPNQSYERDVFIYERDIASECDALAQRLEAFVASMPTTRLYDLGTEGMIEAANQILNMYAGQLTAAQFEHVISLQEEAVSLIHIFNEEHLVMPGPDATVGVDNVDSPAEARLRATLVPALRNILLHLKALSPATRHAA
jgi:hypothetical protein